MTEQREHESAARARFLSADLEKLRALAANPDLSTLGRPAVARMIKRREMQLETIMLELQPPCLACEGGR